MVFISGPQIDYNSKPSSYLLILCSVSPYLNVDLMYRGRGSSSSRGPWRGRSRGLPFNSRGRGATWNKGKEPASKETVDDSPRGRLVTEITLDNASSYGDQAENAKISDCRYAASYSLVDSNSPKIIIPGQPAAWKPPQLPCQLEGDHGDYLRDQNGARFKDHPMQPSVQSLFAMNKEFDPSSVDIMGCASSLGDILRFVRSVESTFRFDVEMVGNTLFLVRNCRDQLIPDVRGYGHSFLDAFTSYDAEVEETKSHQRIISYSFGSLECLVRFECDGYLADGKGGATAMTSKPENLTPPESPIDGSITAKLAGVTVSQQSVLEIKTRSLGRGLIDMNEHLPRLWLRQIPNFITAYHERGNFADVQEKAVHRDMIKWEIEHESELRRFASVLRQLIVEVKRASHLKLELCRTGLGPLELREQCGNPREVLPSDWKDRWARQHRGLDGNGGARLSDGDGDESSPSSSSDESESDDDDFCLDYTACDLTCGYCGRCA
ncbi:hypothetical protein F5Y04DRAFT_6611 [Hypomontagnella monticulosa]|nr:hypothetical protein F5Y04DRAFT_6611 [Hypomontagnella monticulosa]